MAPEVDHVELFGPPAAADAHSRNFVLCPGKAYDRSPCGTGTSAKLACLAADGKLAEDQPWIQESILGTRFTASYAWADAPAAPGPPGVGPPIGLPIEPTIEPTIVPTITGRAHVTARGELLLDPDDPFCWGRRDRA
jgi:proline racemase